MVTTVLIAGLVTWLVLNVAFVALRLAVSREPLPNRIGEQHPRLRIVGR
jgi:hypothetical protein